VPCTVAVHCPHIHGSPLACLPWLRDVIALTRERETTSRERAQKISALCAAYRPATWYPLSPPARPVRHLSPCGPDGSVSWALGGGCRRAGPATCPHCMACCGGGPVCLSYRPGTGSSGPGCPSVTVRRHNRFTWSPS